MRKTLIRPGFTLIEMLVVIIIILVLATLTVAITPKIAGEQKVAKAADQVQGWCLLAKSRATRDLIPTGIRLIPDPTNLSHVRELQYVQQPDDYVGGKVTLVVDPVNKKLSVAVFSGVDFTGGFTIPAAQPVQVGDYFEIKGGGMVHLVLGIRANALDLLWKDPPPHPLQTPTEEYRIIRKPRVLIGETPMLLAKDMVVDKQPNNPIDTLDPFRTKNLLPPPNLDGSIDLMFSPSGALMNIGGNSNSHVCLWFRDVTADAPLGLPVEFGGTLVSIQRRTGFIAAHPVDTTPYLPPNPPYKPYSYVTDGKSSGL